MTSKRRNWLLIVIVIALVVLLRGTNIPQRVPTAYFESHVPMVVAYQGGSGLRPGNTQIAFAHARSLNVDVLHMDVRMSADENLVVIHDATVDRTTDGTGLVAQMTLTQLQVLDAAYQWSLDIGPGANVTPSLDSTMEHNDKGLEEVPPYRGRNTRIPILAQVLEAQPKQRINIDVQTDNSLAGKLLCQLLRRTGRGELVLVTSTHTGVLGEFREHCPDVATGAGARELTLFIVLYRLGLLRLLDPAIQQVTLPARRFGIDLMSPDVVADARAWNLAVAYQFQTKPELMQKAIFSRAQVLVTTRPDLLMEELGRR